MSKASLELGGGNWAAKDRKLLGYAVGDTSGKYVPREFDFTRNSDISATRVNEDGLIEKYRENLLLQSNQFDTTWTNISTTETGGQAGYDGSSDAWDLSNTAASGHIRQLGLSLTGVQTFSIYAKAGSLNWIKVTSQSGNVKINVNLADGTIGTLGNLVLEASTVAMGNGWYRCVMSFDATTTGIFIYPATADDDTTQTSGNIYIQDAQLEYGLVATDYLESGSTTGKAGILDNLPRIDYTGGSASLLLEPQRTNVCTNSEDVSNWSLTFATATPNDTISPEGVQNAAKIVTSNLACDVKLTSIPVSPSTTYTATFYCKLTSGSGLQTRFYDNTNGANIEYYDYSSQLVVGEWKRVTRTFTTPAGCNNIQIWFLAASSSASVTAHYWGYQLEEGSYPTSYIPTYGVSATRNKDVCLKTGISDLIGQTEGTIFVDFDFNNFEGGYDWFGLTDGTSDNRLILGNKDSSTEGYRLFVVSGGTTSIDLRTGDTSAYGQQKVAIKYSNGEYKVFVNGSSIIDTTGASSFANILDQFRYDDGISLDLYSTINQTLLFPTALTDSECIALTTL